MFFDMSKKLSTEYAPMFFEVCQLPFPQVKNILTYFITADN